MECHEKQAYRTKAIACQHRAESRKHGVELYVYKCPTCGKWHLTKWKWEGAA